MSNEGARDRRSDRCPGRALARAALVAALGLSSVPVTAAEPEGASPAVETPTPRPPTITWDMPIEMLPDLRGEDPELPVPARTSGDFFVVPVPMSSPTFGTGLVLAGAYFYPQTPEEKATQPASFTGAAAGYTSNKSWAGGVMQQNYFDGDRWRFNAFAGAADFRLELVQSLDQPDQSVLDWVVSGGFVQSSLSRRVGENWFVGATVRYLDISQDLDLDVDAPEFTVDNRIEAPGIGLNAEFDTRDVPSNPYRGMRVEFKSMLSDQRQRSDGTYLAMAARIRMYHSLRDNLVLAWDVNGCQKSGRIPLWDTCRLNLRGFPITDYLSEQSLSGQVEARWRLSKRWGVVGFAGAGIVDRPFADNGDGQTIPSYGVGVRFMVLPSQRINLRLDYGRSDTGSGAWYLAVSEAF